ncbi:hypothetical protein [Algoriphagus jejuensis]|uniref:hypothetical protein n=1 Tax=Algoriphagus jejuensis TaxID=419934 RepID=UPI0031DA3E1B
MKQFSSIFSASLAVYLLVFPVLFFGLHSHSLASVEKAEILSISDQDVWLDQEVSDCSLCDIFYSQVGIFQTTVYSFVAPHPAACPQGIILSESWKIFPGIGVRGPPSQG